MLNPDYEVKLVDFNGEVKIEQDEDLWKRIEATKNKKEETDDGLNPEDS